MHLLFLVFVVGSPLFVRGYSYENGIVKCPDEIVGISFNVTELNNTTFTKVNRTMLDNYRTSAEFEKFTTSCTTGVKDMSEMFVSLGTFNHSISTWDTSSVTYMNRMFHVATSFNQDISNWTTSSVKYMIEMFKYAGKFNSDISIWNTSSVVSMEDMFNGAEKFNSSISNWNTSSVTSMYSMFSGAKNFNSDISKWNTSSVENMYGMFFGAEKFNQSLTNWCVNISEPTHFAYDSPIKDYPAFLPLWNGIGCTYKCYNNGVRAIPYLENYTCICDQDHMGPYCEEAITTTLTSTYTSTLTTTSSSTLTSTSSSTLTTTYTSIEEDRSANSINVNVIIGLISGGVVLVGFVFFVFCLF